MGAEFKSTDKFTATVTNNTDAYASGDLVGSVMQFVDLDNRKATSGLVTAVTVTDKDKQSANVDLLLFDEEPVNTTWTNNSAIDVDDLDLGKVVPGSPIQITRHHTLNDSGYSVADSLAVGFRARSSTALYGALIARSTPTYTAANALTVALSILQDDE